MNDTIQLATDDHYRVTIPAAAIVEPWVLTPSTLPGGSVIICDDHIDGGFVPNVLVQFAAPPVDLDEYETILPPTTFRTEALAGRTVRGPGDTCDEETAVIAMVGVVPVLQIERWHHDSAGNRRVQTVASVPVADAARLAPSLHELFEQIEVES